MARARRRRHLALTAALFGAVLVACGGQGGGPGTAVDTPGPAGGESSAIPAVTVLDVSTGADFALGSIVPSDRPVLVWFWAPH